MAAGAAVLALSATSGLPAQARAPELGGDGLRARTAHSVAAVGHTMTTPPAQVVLLAKGTHQRTGRNVVTAKIILQPGGYIDWHTHPGLALGIVTGGGTLTIVTTGCGELTYPTGEAFTPPRSVHTARNRSDAPLTILGTFFVKGKPTVMADPAKDARLDARCGLDE